MSRSRDPLCTPPSEDPDSEFDSEESHDRGVIRMVLAMPLEQRLRSLGNFYELYKVGQQRRGRRLLEPERE